MHSCHPAAYLQSRRIIGRSRFFSGHDAARPSLIIYRPQSYLVPFWLSSTCSCLAETTPRAVGLIMNDLHSSANPHALARPTSEQIVCLHFIPWEMENNFLTFQFFYFIVFLFFLLFYGHSSGNKIQMKLNKRQVEGRTIPGPGAPQDCSVPSDTLSVYFREIYVNTRMVTNKSDQQDKRPLYDRNFSCSSIYLPSQLSLSLFSNRLLGDGRSKTRISILPSSHVSEFDNNAPGAAVIRRPELCTDVRADK